MWLTTCRMAFLLGGICYSYILNLLLDILKSFRIDVNRVSEQVENLKDSEDASSKPQAKRATNITCNNKKIKKKTSKLVFFSRLCSSIQDKSTLYEAYCANYQTIDKECIMPENSFLIFFKIHLCLCSLRNPILC